MIKYARLFLLAVVCAALGAGAMYLIVNVILGLEGVTSSVVIGAVLGLYFEYTSSKSTNSKAV